MKLGLFGGSFDPPHLGHLLPVEEARRSLGLDRVLYLPTADPPHKPRRCFAPPAARYAMVELAVLHREGLFASDHELTPGRRAYTADTVSHFAQELPGTEVHLLLGADSVVELHRWRRWREILDGAHLAILARPGWDSAELAVRAHPLICELLAAGEARIAARTEVDASSTGIREILARGEEPPADLLPPLVLDYLRKYPLYR